MLDYVNRPANLSSSTFSSLVVGWSVVGIFGWQSVFEEGEIVGEEDVVHNAAQIYNSVERNGGFFKCSSRFSASKVTNALHPTRAIFSRSFQWKKLLVGWASFFFHSGTENL